MSASMLCSLRPQHRARPMIILLIAVLVISSTLVFFSADVCYFIMQFLLQAAGTLVFVSNLLILHASQTKLDFEVCFEQLV